MRVWISDPSYANHGPTITSIGLKLAEYPFLNRKTMMLRSGAFLKTLGSLGPSDAVLLHGSCHNPSGLKLSDGDWHKIAEIARKKDSIPLLTPPTRDLGTDSHKMPKA